MSRGLTHNSSSQRSVLRTTRFYNLGRGVLLHGGKNTDIYRDTGSFFLITAMNDHASVTQHGVGFFLFSI